MDEPEQEVSYENLQELVRTERRSNKLMPVPARFWPKVRTFMKQVTDEFREEQEKDPWSRKAMLLSDEVKNAKHAAENLWALRERKLAMLALAKERNRKKPDGITADEGQLYDAMLATLDQFRGGIFEGTISAPGATPPPSVQPVTVPAAPTKATPEAAPQPAAVPEAPDQPAPEAPSEPAIVPADQQGIEPALTIRALGDIPPFVGPDMQTYLLKEGDLATVPPPIANLLVKRKKAAIVDGL